MLVTVYEVVGIMAAVIAILMLGSRNVRFQLSMLSFQIVLIAGETAMFAHQYDENNFYWIAFLLFLQRAVIVPIFLDWIVQRIDVSRDPGMILPAPLTMHLSILLFGLSFFVANHLPMPTPTEIGSGIVIASATGAISLLFSGLVMMLTRRLALSQIIGFITLENGVYVFALTQTDGLPFFIEMAVLFDILGAIMIAGVLIFNIKRSFEHIDVSRLKDLKH
jgi:hydrogenase-4 component E